MAGQPGVRVEAGVVEDEYQLQQGLYGKEKFMRTIIVLCLLAVLSIMFPMHANAADSYVCTVDQAGPSGASAAGGAKVRLTDTAANPAWTGGKTFQVPAKRSKEFLAVGIAAIANDKKVRVFTDPSMTTVTAIYLMKQ
jgi:hypothetical protein